MGDSAPTAPPLPARQFVILSTQRSGSNWLEDRLAGHPNITMYREEVFRPTLDKPVAYRSYRDAAKPRRLLGRAAPPVSKFRYLRWLHRNAPEAAPVIGFRLMYDQLRRNPSLGVLLATQRTPVVHLVRENVLATHVSVVAARTSGLYVTRSTEKKTPPVRLDAAGLVADLERRVALIERHRRMLRVVPHIEVGFRELTTDAASCDRRMLDFLGLPVTELGSAVRRSGDRPLAERIVNLDEITEALRDTCFADALDSSQA